MKFFRWLQNKDAELDAEIRSHLDEAIRDRIAHGETLTAGGALANGYGVERRWAGGCKPSRSNDRRKLMTPGRFKSKDAIVARPMGVKPMSMRQSGCQAKCSCQSS